MSGTGRLWEQTAAKEPGTWNNPCYGINILLQGKMRTTAKGRILKALCVREVFWRGSRSPRNGDMDSDIYGSSRSLFAKVASGAIACSTGVSRTFQPNQRQAQVLPSCMTPVRLSRTNNKTTKLGAEYLISPVSRINIYGTCNSRGRRMRFRIKKCGVENVFQCWKQP